LQETSLVPEVYISVDVETAGPNPYDYSLLSIGACCVEDVEQSFYVELQPLSMKVDPAAMAVNRLSLSELAEKGLPPAEALKRFEAWVAGQVPPGHKPVLVAFNAAFDWMFLNDYFHRLLGHNPLGHSALDIKAFYMGLTGVNWSDTSIGYVGAYCGNNCKLTHNALRDAQDQARLFNILLAESRQRRAKVPTPG
jgi:ribonuclease T